MTFLGEIRIRARHIVGPVLAATLFAYFAYHAVQGDRGLIAWIKLNQQVEEARLEQAAIGARRDALARKVHQLQPQTIDADLLEERIRVVLGYFAPNDVLIGPPDDRQGIGLGYSPIDAVRPLPDTGKDSRVVHIALKR
jgi:cell division protein FtsB